tara:strand:- start:472 stop:1179 length:708 start_codon:yes stop_codon:yes gene_type:complete
MPLIFNKYNKYYSGTRQGQLTVLKQDISNNYVISCNPNDSLHKLYLTNKADYLINQYSNGCAKNTRGTINSVNQYNISLTDSQLATQQGKIKQLFQYKRPCQFYYNLDTLSSLTPDQTQKIIQNQVRVSSSLYTDNLGALSVNNNFASDTSCNIKPWHNSSDRIVAHGLKFNHTNKTSILPNYGVDIKHNSYDRYLNRKKGKYYKSEEKVTPPPFNGCCPSYYGNKTQKFNIVKC